MLKIIMLTVIVVISIVVIVILLKTIVLKKIIKFSKKICRIKKSSYLCSVLLN